MADHDFPVGGINIGRGKVFGYVAAVIVRERVFQSPCGPVLYVDDAADRKLFHERRVVSQVVKGALVWQEGGPVVHERAIG